MKAWSARGSGLGRALGLWLALGLGLGLGCSKDPRQAERLDARALEEVIAVDHELEAALREADGLSRTDEKKAAEVLETKAMPLAKRVAERATGTVVTTPWGMERKAELEGVARDRKDELPAYAKALRGEDLKTKLDALEKQLALQKRAMDVAGRVTVVPPVSVSPSDRRPAVAGPQ